MAELDQAQWNDIELLLRQIAENTAEGPQYRGPISDMSQSAGRDRLRSNSNDNSFNFNPRRSSARRDNKYNARKPLDQFEEGLTKSLLDAISGPGGFDASIKRSLNSVAKSFGTDLKNFSGDLGKEVGVQILKKSGLAQGLSNGIKTSLTGDKGLFAKLANSAGGDLGNAITAARKSFIGNAAEMSASTVASTGAMAELGGVIADFALAAAPVLPAVVAIGVALEVLSPALEGLADVSKALGSSAFKEDELRAKRREAAQKRLIADVNYLVEQPFEILNKAANEWYNTWDSTLRDVSQTQGYNKEAVYNLYASYAERLRQDNLSSVIASTDIISNLDQVLKSGLSGKVAEEFAYVATKLNNAIPNQDFFGYAASYAQIAANAVAQGSSQEQALALANQQLEQFASNLLYSSRELSGGFSTGLQNASQLFTDAVNIAQTARSGNVSAISGTLTSVSAVIGAVAPDLANGLVQNIVNAAIGGNDDNIVALRSLAGINAGNTEFLRAFAEDPQAIFGNIFTKLADLQSMSNDNFMEVAEGLAPIFGVDMAALSRVDFNYLAQAITQMNANSNSLEQNLELLASGQSTTTAEQAKMAEINQMILDEGLGIVIDNEAARMVQQHMWDEQRDAAMQSATYAVDLQGAALSLLEGIAQTVTIISRFSNPYNALDEAIGNIEETLNDTMTQRQVLNEILVKGAVKGSNSALDKLLNYSGMSQIDVFSEGLTDSNYNLLTNTRLSSMLFGLSGITGSDYASNYSESMASAVASGIAEGVINSTTGLWGTTGVPYAVYNGLNSAGRWLSNARGGLVSTYNIARNNLGSNSSGSSSEFGSAVAQSINDALVDPMYFSGFNKSRDSIISNYTWSTVGKSSARFRSALTKQGLTYNDVVGNVLGDETELNKGKLKNLLDNIDTVNQAVVNLEADATTGKFATSIKDVVSKSNTMSYEEWVNSQFGDRDSYLEAISAYGTTEAAVKGQFDFGKARANAAAEEARADAAFAFNQDARNMINELRAFWKFSAGTYYDQYWHTFFDDGMKFDARMDSILAEMANIRDNYIGIPDKADTIRGLLNTINSTVISFNESFTDWVQQWTDYYINHTTYTARTTSADWAELEYMEQSASRDTALALANALEGISNIEDLKDPTVQSNVLLAKIVVILEAMMQQNNSTGGLSLIDSLSAMSLGLTNRT